MQMRWRLWMNGRQTRGRLFFFCSMDSVSDLVEQLSDFTMQWSVCLVVFLSTWQKVDRRSNTWWNCFRAIWRTWDQKQLYFGRRHWCISSWLMIACAWLCFYVSGSMIVHTAALQRYEITKCRSYPFVARESAAGCLTGSIQLSLSPKKHFFPPLSLSLSLW